MMQKYDVEYELKRRQFVLKQDSPNLPHAGGQRFKISLGSRLQVVGEAQGQN